ncbi:hypothetical protein VaNZ11_013312 [Volvox africanus]|uniref:Transmembrane protein 186 n=1 Tax=Volvox africanus TaxID=51714 RepID=A0ABQ5SH25_9CHLO|nr:hypothetical protein VaNZ11_013312 [Volvox africanus]
MAGSKISAELFLFSRRSPGEYATTVCQVLHIAANQYGSNLCNEANISRQPCGHWLEGGQAGFSSSGLRRLLPQSMDNGTLGDAARITSITSRRLYSARIHPFEGLKLQAPSNPFAPRKPRPAVRKLVLYRGRGMLLFRFIVRAKVFQLMGFLACAVFASVVLTTANPNPMDLAAVGCLAVGCVVTSYCIWYYSGRYVGELSLLLPERRVLRFSVLDFWGNREDNDIPMELLVAPWRNRSVAEVRSQAQQALMPVEVVGDRQYYISVPHGHVLQKEILQKILYGAPIDETVGSRPAEGHEESDLPPSPSPESSMETAKVQNVEGSGRQSTAERAGEQQRDQLRDG